MPKAKPPEAEATSAPTEGEQKPRPSGLIPFQPGQSGNPAGRAKGSRNKLGEAFVEALHDDFIEHGVKVIQTVRTEKPDQYLKVVASLLPKELKIETTSDLTDEQLDQRIRQLAAVIGLEVGTGVADDRAATSPGSQSTH